LKPNQPLPFLNSMRDDPERSSKSQPEGNVDPEALVSEGNRIQSGDGITPENTRAFTLFSQAALAGHAEAQFQVAECLRLGRGVQKDEAQARAWLLKSAGARFVKACIHLGVLYQRSGSRDDDQAIRWFQKAAEAGSRGACAVLAGIYKERSDLVWEPPPVYFDMLVQEAESIYFSTKGDGITEPATRAFGMFLRAAEAGISEAQNYLGLCYQDGDGVRKDGAEAARWLRMAAEQGNALAQNNLATCYSDAIGVPQDYAEAVRWFLKAGEQGQAKAQNHLGVCYANGLGVPKDLVEAARWHRQAADQGHDWAQFSLRLCYRDGTGVERDPAQAYRWLQLAADQGHEKASQKLASLVGVMSPSEGEAGQRLYKEDKPSYER
jgi:TPR repeat protein